MKHQLWHVPEPSTAAFSGFALMMTNGKYLDLHLDYDRDGKVFRSGIRFGKVRAYRHRAELYTTPWHITDSYDTLVEVTPSEWLAELINAAPSDRRNDWVLRHFMLTLDSAGCYEVVAETWEPLPELEGSLTALAATFPQY